jgi:hypothetical protein
MNRREHSHRIACAMQVTFSRNVSAKVSFEPRTPGGMRVQQDSAAHVSLSSIFNCQRSDSANAMSWAVLLLAPARQSVAHAALLDFTRANFSVASGAPPSLWGVYSRGTLGVSTPLSKFFYIFATVSRAVQTTDSLPQGQWFSVGSGLPQRSPIAAPLPADQYSPLLRGFAPSGAWLEGVWRGHFLRTASAFVDFAHHGRQLSRQQR